MRKRDRDNEKKATIRNKLYKLCYGENSGDCNESLLSSLFFFLAFCFTIYWSYAIFSTDQKLNNYSVANCLCFSSLGRCFTLFDIILFILLILLYIYIFIIVCSFFIHFHHHLMWLHLNWFKKNCKLFFICSSWFSVACAHLKSKNQSNAMAKSTSVCIHFNVCSDILIWFSFKWNSKQCEKWSDQFQLIEQPKCIFIEFFFQKNAKLTNTIDLLTCWWTEGSPF